MRTFVLNGKNVPLARASKEVVVLVRSEPGRYDKLEKLAGMATDDVLSRPRGKEDYAAVRAPYSRAAKNPAPGVYRASMPNGKTINLFRVMFTDFCKMDCHFCPNSHWVPRKRFSFTVDELARTFHEMERRHTVAGLFLSSGVAGSGSKTTERLIKVVDLIRNKYNFGGYVHLKVMPGTEYQYVEQAYRLGTRLSVNLETPTVEGMKRLSKMKDMERDMLSQMRWMDSLLRRRNPGGAVGQVTQLVVGAADESDWDIYQRMAQLYGRWNFKRVYYNPFLPIRYTPLEDHEPTPMWRTNRLYQIDWLKRIYRYDDEEIRLAYDPAGFLSLEDDPKTVIALSNADKFPLDINSAGRADLLRVPGIGPTSAARIIRQRVRHTIDTWRDLESMGVVRRRAAPFVSFPGNVPAMARQLKLDLFKEWPTRPAARMSSPRPVATGPCGLARSCSGCALYGAPGHPGYRETKAA